MVIYAIWMGFLTILLIAALGFIIYGIKGVYANSKNKLERKAAKWVPIVLHALQAGFLCFWVIDALFPLMDGAITAIETGIFAFINRHFFLLLIIGLVIWFLFFRKQDEKEIIKGPLVRPSERDYFRALDTLRPAAAEIAGPLGFAPIDTYTDMAPNPADRIKPWGPCWLMVYKIPKANAAAEVNLSMMQRALEAQIDTVIQRDNPSGYAEVCFPWQGVDKPLLLVHEVLDRDAFIYVFIVKASREYFESKAAADGRKSREIASTPGTLYDD